MKKAKMTEREARTRLLAAAEDAEWDAEEVEDIFHALYGRDADDADRGEWDGQLLSLCYAAIT